jgi:hypothetical protein
MLGNSITHFKIYEFLKIIKNIDNALRPGGLFIIEYKDAIEMLLHYDVIRREDLKKNLVFSFHSNYNPTNGYLERTFYNITKQIIYDVKFYIWFQSLVHSILWKQGFHHIESRKVEQLNYCLEIFKAHKTGMDNELVAKNGY